MAVAVPPPPRPLPAGSAAKPGGRKGKDKATAQATAQATAAAGAPDAAAEETFITLSILTRVLAEGMRPVCLQLASLSQQLGDVSDSAGRISTSLHPQGVGSDRTANAVVQLQGAVRGVFDGVGKQVKSEAAGRDADIRGTSDPTDEDDRLQLATRNEGEVRRVRDVAKQMMLFEIVSANEGLHVMPSGARVLNICYQATEHVLRVDRAGAQEYMESRRLFINAEGKAAEKRAPVSEKLNRVKDHLLEALRKVSMATYFESLGVDVAELTQAEAHGWLNDSQYAKSDPAKKAANAAMKALFLRTGQSDRVVAAAIGQCEYVIASMGQVALIAYWACVSFEKVVGVRKARHTGNDDGSYVGWREHMILVNTFLRHHTRVQDGLLLSDGDEERRVQLVADDGTYTVDEDAVVAATDGFAGGSGASEGDRADDTGGDRGLGGGRASDDSRAGDDRDVRVDAIDGMEGLLELSNGATRAAPSAPYVGEVQMFEAPQPDADTDWVQPRDDRTTLSGSLEELLEEEEIELQE
ncbi:hypothetical protein I4F81_011017 [Pyropia yezoensis]|uniref:Uncharacterized protein n=1 Tax=Pyropia yezoensis TaxID=2788 RepID=A0ACC3CE57_PYRYE|nr:hypothetical protein I4F81_011017 [Neopyropia yezoensis]